MLNREVIISSYIVLEYTQTHTHTVDTEKKTAVAATAALFFCVDTCAFKCS